MTNAVEQEEEDVQNLESVWLVGGVDNVCAGWETVKRSGCKLRKMATKGIEIQNKFQPLMKDEKEIYSINGKEMTREAQIEFNEASVRKPLASARLVAKAGNGIWLEENGGYIEHLTTGERMAVRVVNDVYVFGVELDDMSKDVVTLDSGAGCSVWPRGRHAGKAKMEAKKPGVGMVAANGTPIEHLGQRKVRFRGVKAETAGFSRRA